MKDFLFYKIKKYNNHWIVVFLNNTTDEATLIKDDVLALKKFLDEKKDFVFIGANNYTYDDILLTSLVKNNSINGKVNDDDITSLLPITLDITQGIVRNNLIDYNNMVCCIWDEEGNALPYEYSIKEEDISKQLTRDVAIIRSFYQNEERKKFLDWKLDIVEKYNLPKRVYHYSFGDIMREILGLKINENSKRKVRKISVDPKLEKLIEDKNDEFLNDLLNKLKDYYINGNNIEKLTVKIGDCLVKFNEQGILGSKEEDYIDIDNKNDNVYLYIDFNSFGPNILINNNWLDKVATNPQRYSEVKDIRIALKAKKNIEQLYYKNILNAGLDYLNKVYTRNGVNVGYSLSTTGIMTMMLLYRNIEQYNAELIECNTDGLIVKCPKSKVEDIKNEVKKIESDLSLSCDVDVVKKIVHFNTMNYVMEFEDGSEKHLGVFGNFQIHPLYCSGITAVEVALRNYYMNGIPVSKTLRELRNNNDLESFQIVKKQRKNEKDKYIKVDGEYILYDRSTSRLFAVREDKLKNSFYVKNNKNDFEEYKVKRGKSVKDGYYYFELSDSSLPNIYDVDLNYYIDECYKVINKHPTNKDIQIKDNIQKNCFLDLDGTLVFDKDDYVIKRSFNEAVDGLVSDEEKQVVYRMLVEQKGSYVLQFLGLCKKYKGYGTIDNFAEFLKSVNLFPGKSINDYKDFVFNFVNNERIYSTELGVFDESLKLLEYLKSEGYKTILYSNWYKMVQDAKLENHGLAPYINDMCTIDDSYAKTSVKGWEDVLESKNVRHDDFNIMIGNGTSDLVPKALNIPSIIVNHTGIENGKTITSNGIIVNGFSEVMNPNFYSEIEEIKRTRKIK